MNYTKLNTKGGKRLRLGGYKDARRHHGGVLATKVHNLYLQLFLAQKNGAYITSLYSPNIGGFDAGCRCFSPFFLVSRVPFQSAQNAVQFFGWEGLDNTTMRNLLRRARSFRENPV